MFLRQLFDRESYTYTYIIACDKTRDAIIIDPVRECVKRDINLIKELGLNLSLILETHVHADHVTGASELADEFQCEIGLSVGSGVKSASKLIDDNETLTIGELKIKCLMTPGHTKGCMSYVINENVFTGDCLLIRKTGRCDFQGGSAVELYQSIKNKLYTLDSHTKVYPGHDYTGQTYSTVGEELEHNTRINRNTSLEEFRQTMANLKLDYPKKIDEALPLNMVLGKLD